MRRLFFCGCFALAAVATLLPGFEVMAQSTATYRVVFTSTWSATTHPQDFPSNAHYSPLKAATHDASVSFWDSAALASDGIESMAETGNNATLDAEMTTAQNGGSAQFIINGPGLNTSPDDAEIVFDITTEHPRFTIVSMIAPSPDWFVGVSGLELHDGTMWTDTATVTAFAYDAGTDDGTTYESPNADTDPPSPIAMITDPPFDVSGTVQPVGSFSFTLLSVTDTEEIPDGSAHVSSLYPNPFRDQGTIRVDLSRPQTVTVDLFDVLGRRVVTRSEQLSAGSSELVIDGSGLAGGLYLYRIRSLDLNVASTAILAQ